MMIFSKSPIWFLMLLPLVGLSCSSVPQRKLEVTTIGVGTNIQEAKNDAIRQGIQYLVGSYVTSDLESNNESIVKDNVTDYSGAIVERFEILNQKRRADGLYELKVRIRIAGDANRQRNSATLGKPSQIDGQSFNAEALSRIKAINDIKHLWENALTGFPGRAFEYMVYDPNITTIPDNNDQVTLAFYTAVFWRVDFINEIKTLLEATGRPLKVTRRIPLSDFWNNGSQLDQQTGICLKNGLISPESDIVCYIVDIPSHLFRNWLCMEPDLEFSFDAQGVDSASLSFQRKMVVDLQPYLGYTSSGTTSIFVFYIVDNEMIQDRTDYQEKISALWHVTVPVNGLSAIKTIRAETKCPKT